MSMLSGSAKKKRGRGSPSAAGSEGSAMVSLALEEAMGELDTIDSLGRPSTGETSGSETQGDTGEESASDEKGRQRVGEQTIGGTALPFAVQEVTAVEDGFHAEHGQVLRRHRAEPASGANGGEGKAGGPPVTAGGGSKTTSRAAKRKMKLAGKLAAALHKGTTLAVKAVGGNKRLLRHFTSKFRRRAQGILGQMGYSRRASVHFIDQHVASESLVASLVPLGGESKGTDDDDDDDENGSGGGGDAGDDDDFDDLDDPNVAPQVRRAIRQSLAELSDIQQAMEAARRAGGGGGKAAEAKAQRRLGDLVKRQAQLTAKLAAQGYRGSGKLAKKVKTKAKQLLRWLGWSRRRSVTFLGEHGMKVDPVEEERKRRAEEERKRKAEEEERRLAEEEKERLAKAKEEQRRLEKEAARLAQLRKKKGGSGAPLMRATKSGGRVQVPDPVTTLLRLEELDMGRAHRIMEVQT